MDITLLQKATEKVLGAGIQIYSFHHEGGGEINQSYKVIADKGVFYVKVHDSSKYPKLFEREMFGLQTLRKTHTVEVVEPFGITEMAGMNFFFTDYVESAPESQNFWSDLGERLAHLHMNSNRYFGFQEDNFIGNQIQINHRSGNWGQFFIRNRLLPNVRTASENQMLNDREIRKFDKYFSMVEVLFPEEEPSLIHGNLWREHIMVGSKGNAVVSNPSCYFGHREMDIAMTMSVGQFPEAFYEAYHATFPLEKEWKTRIEFCLMYYHLVNLNTYGSPYLSNVLDNLNKWVR